MDLALNNLQRLICHKTQQTKPNQWALELSKIQTASFRIWTRIADSISYDDRRYH